MERELQSAVIRGLMLRQAQHERLHSEKFRISAILRNMIRDFRYLYKKQYNRRMSLPRFINSKADENLRFLDPKESVSFRVFVLAVQ